MKLIINVPDDQFDLALAVAMEERTDYARRYDKPGWGWVIYRDCTNFWVSGIKGGISVRLYKSPSQSEADRESTGWRTIDSAPRDTDVLLYCPELAVSNPERIELGQAVMTHGQDRGWSYHSWATHWQPLPAAPMLARSKSPQDDQASSSLDAGRSGGGAS